MVDPGHPRASRPSTCPGSLVQHDDIEAQLPSSITMSKNKSIKFVNSAGGQGRPPRHAIGEHVSDFRCDSYDFV